MRVTTEDNPRLEYLREKTRGLTTSPGCYIMKNHAGTIIYIGKAKNLRNRVQTYFHDNDHLPKVARMVSNVYDYDFIVTSSDYEALVLEASLIKQHKPKYNILLKDDKGYSYIKISDEEYPRITREMQKKGSGTFIGPYTSGLTSSQTVEEVNRVFMLPTCKRVFPRDFGKGRPCLNFQIKRCIGLCRGCFSKEDYAEIINQAVDYIKSGSKQSVEALTEEMNRLSENLEFEKAAVLRDRIVAINRAADTQKIFEENMPDTDIFALAKNGGITCISVLNYRLGRLYDKQDFILGETTDDISTREDFLIQYYDRAVKIPREIYIDEELRESSNIKRYLQEKSGHAVSISNPKRGEMKGLLDLAEKNAVEQLSVRIGRTGKEVAVLEELGELLGLKKTPNYIECYDISNLGSQDMVAGMVVMDKCRFAKKYYKKFNIKTVQEQNDYASMREVISRRLENYLDPECKDDGFKRLPDVIFLDGGKGHVSAVLPLLGEYGLDIPLFGLVKDNKHHTRAVVTADGSEIVISRSRSVFALLTKLQDEVHRYTITFQKQKRSTHTHETELTKIYGIGEKKAQALLNEFKTKQQLKSATIEDIAAVMKISPEKAQEVKEKFIDQLQ
ncbi:MAG: excinuclease ABC subunit UvrC [Oscillospiraceae bacterium]|nr:excinuclease ABC subunit UvrC [Oscillospiraceae bacterium]